MNQPALSNVGMSKSYNCINISYTKIQNKTTTVVVFTVSYTYSSESHLHIQNYILHLHDQSAEPTVMHIHIYSKRITITEIRIFMHSYKELYNYLRF